MSQGESGPEILFWVILSPTTSCGALSPTLGGLLLTGSLKEYSYRHGERVFAGAGQTCCLAV